MTGIGTGNSLFAAQNIAAASHKTQTANIQDQASFLAALEPGTTPLATVATAKASFASASASTNFYTQAIAQGSTTVASTEGAASSDSVQQKFLNYAKETPIQRMRSQILNEMGLSEQQVADMTPQQQAKVEAQIKEKIQEEMEKKTGTAGSGATAPDTTVADIAASL